MATLVSIHYVPHRAEVCENSVSWVKTRKKMIEELPQIMWADNRPWREANLWALTRASDQKRSLKTIWSAMKHIHAYAKWLEHEAVAWWHFPEREADRCLVRYRGALVDAIKNGEIAPSTAQQRMACAIRFYRWLAASRLLSPEWPMWQERMIGIHLHDSFGFDRTIVTKTTDLAIPNRKAIGEKLEDGLLPIASENVAEILNFADENASQELALMLRLGFGTGMRFGTIADLKVKTIQNAVPDPWFPGYFLLAVGPGAHPAVHTKFGVTGQIWISIDDLQILRNYMFSARRLKRQSQADTKHIGNVFLTRFSKPFGSEGSDSSRAINVELGRLRKAALAKGVTAFHNFYFHRSRCTFATELARVAIRHGSVGTAIELVMRALLHKNEETSLKYIKFVEKTKVMSEMSDEFTRRFLGLTSSRLAESN